MVEDSSKPTSLPLMPFSTLLRAGLLLVAFPMLSACYYLQAAQGHLDVMQKREPIDAVIDDPDTPEELARRLELLRRARAFSITELGLPDNDSYRTYSDLDRDYVVWNVVAAPELSVEPRTWCFPVAGCVAYRGYFSEDSAWRKAEALQADDYDVFVGGTTAYSTLGKFDDPVLSTMLSRSDTELVALLFHELAHQVLYVRGDTSFNESFASAVEELGIERWLDREGSAEDLERWQKHRAWYADMTRIALEAREDLERIFESSADNEEKRRRKAARLDRLTTELVERAGEAGVDATRWWQDQPLNNARLASWSAYESHVPAFRQVFVECEEDFGCFYDVVASLAELDDSARRAELEALGRYSCRVSPEDRPAYLAAEAPAAPNKRMN
jgi:predicted aminopeptidase